MQRTVEHQKLGSVLSVKGKKEIFIRQLKAKYKQLYTVFQPVLSNQNKLWSVDKIFVEGGIEVCEDSRLHLDSRHFVLSDSFTNSKVCIIVGEPGYGKSTLTLQYAYDWCNSVPNSPLKCADILILLQMIHLRGAGSIFRAVKQFLIPFESQLDEDDIKMILKSSSGVIVLDSFDQNKDINVITSDLITYLTSDVFGESKLIITTRCLPEQYLQMKPQFRLTGFNERRQTEYIRNTRLGYDEGAIDKLKTHLQTNPVLRDICQCPLFFAMFVSMPYETKDFPTFASVTSFFQHLITCLRSHLKKEVAYKNVQKYSTINDDSLPRVAFESLPNQFSVWMKQDLAGKIGQDVYDQYIRLGVLVEEKISNSSVEEKRVRFFHQLFCEWYAAHYLVKCANGFRPIMFRDMLEELDPLTYHYVYRFACGLNRDASKNIIHILKEIKGEKHFATLCIFEQQGLVESNLAIIKDLCFRKTELNKTQTKLLQRSTIQLLEIASHHKIFISRVVVVDLFDAVDEHAGTLCLTSELHLPRLSTLKELWITQNGKVMNDANVNEIVKYSLLCPELDELVFQNCLLPRPVGIESVSALCARRIRVLWWPTKDGDLYRLDIERHHWKHTDAFGNSLDRFMTSREYRRVARLFNISTDAMAIKVFGDMHPWLSILTDNF